MKHTEGDALSRRGFLVRASATGVSLTAAGSLLAACGGGGAVEGLTTTAAAPASGSARRGGTVTFGGWEDPDALDPTFCATGAGRMVFINMMEKLYDIDGSLEIVPQLAADMPEISADGRTVVIPLREGLKFNDGTPFDAKAVKKSLDRHRTLKGSARTSELMPIKRVEVAGPMTVKIHLAAAFAPLTAILADRSGMIMSPAQLDKLGENFARHPIGVGPFEFVSRKAGDKIVLKRAEGYYDADLVKLDGVVYKTMTEGAVRTASLRSGDLDFANKLPTTDIAVLESNPELHVYQAASIGWEGLMVNIGNRSGIGKPYATRDAPISADPRVRQALEMALDRNTINKVAFQGRFKPAYSPISPNTPFGSPETIPARDVEGAAALLKQAGVSGPLKAKMVVRNDEINIRIGQLIQTMAKDAGFDIAVQAMEVTSALDAATQGKFDLFLNGWSGRVDPDGNVYSFAHTSGNQNWSGLSDPGLDKLLDQARASSDAGERKRLYEQAVDKLHEIRAHLFLYRQVGVVAGRSNVGGFAYYADDMPRFKTAGVTS